ncbi:type 2 isopentenyl-diphosphate Delta-isomerase [Paramicrobacterium agarici]|uniref:type 2 isopentenyl-diphosphate Delta-isomerase n=1 Tax=Paramicrobacterium agarici TaxID=630514 RepID=UPI0011522B03|nr:type 2 isopentenyl-diphosphate Delta-isomerase [Microbacterium agarici]TQO21485.1 isopentenyl-diphosphate delta-isomerase [Microbacterium agarici]
MSSDRKDDHVRLATEQNRDRHRPNDFDDVRFVHHAIGAADLDTVSLSTRVGVAEWPLPLYINGMTGGSESTAIINRDLGVVARETGVPIATGSMSPVFKDASTSPGFRVIRDENPDGIVLANLSANASVEQALEAVRIMRADGLQIHINSVQEIVMPEGDRAFSHWPENIARIADALDVPVVVKEVGFGMTGATVARLASLGVGVVDVSGRGGTNFAAIENSRRTGSDFSILSEWGQSAVASLLDARDAAEDGNVSLLASGGVRTPLDAVRALALGASAVGVAGGFLRILRDDGIDALIAEIIRWTEQIRSITALLGKTTTSELTTSDVVIQGGVRDYCLARDIDISGYARRSESEKGQHA